MKKIIKWLIIIFLVLLLLIIYARYVGTSGLVTKEYTIYDKDVSTNFDGMKVVHLSDLHYNRAININKVKNIVNEINLINPDIVVFTGDLIDRDASLSDSDYDDLANSLIKINAKYGKYAVLGNHDYKKRDKIINLYNDIGFKYLENDYDIIYGDDNSQVFIGGIGNVSYNKDDIDKTLEKIDSENQYRIILVHEPDISDKIISKYNVDLILAGHSHNGQVRLPFIGAIVKPPHAKKYYDNYYNLKGTKLYVSSGIGVSNVNYRLWNRPSINFYRINKETNNEVIH